MWNADCQGKPQHIGSIHSNTLVYFHYVYFAEILKSHEKKNIEKKTTSHIDKHKYDRQCEWNHNESSIQVLNVHLLVCFIFFFSHFAIYSIPSNILRLRCFFFLSLVYCVHITALFVVEWLSENLAKWKLEDKISIIHDRC